MFCQANSMKALSVQATCETSWLHFHLKGEHLAKGWCRRADVVLQEQSRAGPCYPHAVGWERSWDGMGWDGIPTPLPVTPDHDHPQAGRLQLRPTTGPAVVQERGSRYARLCRNKTSKVR